MFDEIHESRMKDFDRVFDSSVKAISNVFVKYNIQEVATSLFASNLYRLKSLVLKIFNHEQIS